MAKRKKSSVISSSNNKVWVWLGLAFFGGLVFVTKDNIANQIGDLALSAKDPINKVIDASDAPFWFRFSANNGNIYAQNMLANILVSPSNSQNLKDEGVKWLTVATNNGDPEAQFKLGKILSEGIIVPSDRKRGLELLIKSSSSPAVVKANPNIYSTIAKQYYYLELDSDPNTIASKDEILNTIAWAEKGVAHNEVESAEFLTDIYLTNKLNLPEVEALKKAADFNAKAISLGSHTNGLMVLINLKLYQLTNDPTYATQYNKYFPAAYVDQSDKVRPNLEAAPIISNK